jgi:hypothetical protein
MYPADSLGFDGISKAPYPEKRKKIKRGDSNAVFNPSNKIDSRGMSG